MAVPPEQIVVGAGAEYLYLLLAQLLGREAVFAVEDPGYPKIRQVYGKCGALAARCPWTARAFPGGPGGGGSQLWSISLPPTTIPPDW